LNELHYSYLNLSLEPFREEDEPVASLWSMELFKGEEWHVTSL